MKSLSHLLTRRLQAVPAKVIIFALVIALIGFADAGYLTVKHYQNVVPPCSITGGCETVLTSVYSTMFGIPVSLLGAIYYLVIAVGMFAFLENRNHEVLRVTLLLTVLGLFASLWFLFLQIFILRSYCAYCLGSVVTSVALFIFAWVIFEKYEEARIMPNDQC